jgi:hypothetical protein
MLQAEQAICAHHNQMFTHRERVAVADINAGYTLLPIQPKYQYRIEHMKMIAIGGAAGAATDVRILGTRSAAAVALMTVAIAQLTQNAINDIASANDLDGGLSFNELDADTAVTVGKTGATLTTLTHVDFIVSYTLIQARTGA